MTPKIVFICSIFVFLWAWDIITILVYLILILLPRLAKSYKEISKTQKNLGKNKEFMSELYSFSKATQFFRKPLYQSSPNAVPLIPFVNGKFKPDDNFFLEL